MPHVPDNAPEKFRSVAFWFDNRNVIVTSFPAFLVFSWPLNNSTTATGPIRHPHSVEIIIEIDCQQLQLHSRHWACIKLWWIRAPSAGFCLFLFLFIFVRKTVSLYRTDVGSKYVVRKCTTSRNAGAECNRWFIGFIDPLGNWSAWEKRDTEWNGEQTHFRSREIYLNFSHDPCNRTQDKLVDCEQSPRFASFD